MTQALYAHMNKKIKIKKNAKRNTEICKQNKTKQKKNKTKKQLAQRIEKEY
jgi:hypothetical protein